MFIESLHRNWPLLHSPFFLPLLWLHMTPSQELVSDFIFEESWWSSEMLWTSPPEWSLSLYLVDSSSYWSLPNWLPYHPRPLTYLVIPHINVLRLLVIPVILSEMNHTLAVAMNPNWILFDTERLSQSSQPQSFLLCLNCSLVLCLCRWKCNYILQLYLPINDALSYCEHIARRKSSLIKISSIICINISL